MYDRDKWFIKNISQNGGKIVYKHTGAPRAEIIRYVRKSKDGPKASWYFYAEGGAAYTFKADSFFGLLNMIDDYYQKLQKEEKNMQKFYYVLNCTNQTVGPFISFGEAEAKAENCAKNTGQIHTVVASVASYEAQTVVKVMHG